MEFYYRGCVCKTTASSQKRRVQKRLRRTQKDYDELKKDYDELKKDFYSTRAYFDNTHENMTDVWRYNRVKGKERHNHATPKPVQMTVRAIKTSTPNSGLVYEPFSGSGTTIIAAEQLNRKCYACEIEPRYVDVAVKRWENLTNKKAQLEEQAIAV